MKRVCILLTLSCLSVSCATTRQSQQIWCDERSVPNASFGEETRSVEVFAIRSEQLARARELLSRRSFLEIQSNIFSEMIEGNEVFEGGRYYLVRSGIYGPVDASVAQLKNESDRPGRRAFQFREIDNLLTVFSFQGVRRERLFPMPILVRLPHPVHSTQAFCHTHY